jgi:DNA-binding response OmpR family regulator
LPRILAVDDDAAIHRMIRLQLTLDGFEVVSVESGHDALIAFETNEPDAVVLDVMLPGMSGLEVLTWIRKRSSVPILLLTGMSDDQDKVEGLDLGADDYITKPFNPEELGARVRAVLRSVKRMESQDSRVIRSGDIVIDFGTRLVHKQDRSISFTRTEWALLFYLAERAGKVVFSNEILSEVWGEEYAADGQMLRVFISRLRTKLDGSESKQSVIRTYKNVGYSLITEGASIPDAFSA